MNLPKRRETDAHVTQQQCSQIRSTNTWKVIGIFLALAAATVGWGFAQYKDIAAIQSSVAVMEVKAQGQREDIKEILSEVKALRREIRER